MLLLIYILTENSAVVVKADGVSAVFPTLEFGRPVWEILRENRNGENGHFNHRR